MTAEDDRLFYLAKVRARTLGLPEPLAPSTFAQAEPAPLPPTVDHPESAEAVAGDVAPVSMAVQPSAYSETSVHPVDDPLVTELHAIVPTLNRDSLVSLVVEARRLRQDQRR